MKPSLPQGTRDFAAAVLRRRRFIINTISDVFELYGFEPLETPSLENLETLMGKYGDEGDKLIFKILNNGLDNPLKREKIRADFENILSGKNDATITERALRYDLTIPFARYMAMNQGKLSLPFKRYQIQPVWRADRPQRGRYREFLQCDADIAGTSSLLSDAELVLVYATVFSRLQLEVSIRINSRKILYALAEACGIPEQLSAITVAVDKLEKIGIEKVKAELSGAGLLSGQVSLVEEYIQITGTSEEKLEKITHLLGTSETGRQGIEELREILEMVKSSGGKPVGPTAVLDLTLARGLNYYTGVIYEVKAEKVKMGSIGGGGRYDNLTGLFGVPDMPGVGISFGVDRIYDVMDELKLFPENMDQSTQVLFFNLGVKESRFAFQLMQQLRGQGISCELNYEATKMDKQFRYASRKNAAFVVIIGSNELETKSCVIKNLATGEQQTIAADQIIPFFVK